ncbi:MAG: peptidylprolyl isomerase [Gammaproteobacteria bacterium]|nr:peptidylprolyl isomerase [Gammaproteobacteria bacterium]
MQISTGSAVTLNYVSRDASGEIIDSSDEDGPIKYIHGTEDLIPGLEKALEGKTTGEKLSVHVPVEEGYGPHDKKLVESVPRKNFEGVDDISSGMQFQTDMDDGTPMIVTVVSVTSKEVTIDGNHPLAGKALDFDLEIIEVHEASSEEIEQGHLHE